MNFNADMDIDIIVFDIDINVDDNIMWYDMIHYDINIVQHKKEKTILYNIMISHDTWYHMI